MKSEKRVLSRRWPATLSLEPSDVQLEVHSEEASFLVFVPEYRALTRLCQVVFGAVPIAMFALACLAEPGTYILICFGVLSFAGSAELCCDRAITIERRTQTISITKYYFLVLPLSRSFGNISPSKIFISSGMTEFGRNKMICVKPGWLRYCILSFQNPTGDQLELLSELCSQLKMLLYVDASSDVDDQLSPESV